MADGGGNSAFAATGRKLFGMIALHAMALRFETVVTIAVVVDSSLIR
jgi:hypothetical protein